MTPVQSLIDALASGAVEVVDLTQPLSERTPVLQLPEPFANTPGLTRHAISRYDDAGPAWAWDWLEIGEHVGRRVRPAVPRACVPARRGQVRADAAGQPRPAAAVGRAHRRRAAEARRRHGEPGPGAGVRPARLMDSLRRQ